MEWLDARQASPTEVIEVLQAHLPARGVGMGRVVVDCSKEHGRCGGQSHPC